MALLRHARRREPRRDARRDARRAPGGRRRRRHRRARQGRRARRARAVRRAARRRRADAAGLAVAAGRAPPRRDIAPQLDDPLLRDRLRQGVHGRHARLAHGAAARRVGRGDHELRGPGGAHPPRRARRLRARRARDRRPRQPRRARRLRGGRDAPARATASSTRSASRPRTSPRFAALGITASVQYTHATSDRDLVERIWADRVDHAYPFRSLWAAGARLAGGSDAPVEELDPLAGLRAAVLRTDSQRPPWRPEQAIPADAALRVLHRRARLAELRRAPPRSSARRASTPTSSCSTAIRWPIHPPRWPTRASWRPWWRASGSTVAEPALRIPVSNLRPLACEE